jgi:hypothetical protein
MIPLLSLLFLLQIVVPCNKILSCGYLPLNVGLGGKTIPDQKSVPGTRYLNPLQQDRWLGEVEKKLFYGTLTENFVTENKIDVTRPQMIVYGGRCDSIRHDYLIEHVIQQQYPVASFEVLLKTGTHVDGFNDYSPIAHILQNVVQYCGTKTTLSDNAQNDTQRSEWQTDANKKLILYKSYLNVLFEYNVDLRKEFPAQNKYGDISIKNLGEQPVNALNFLQKAREFKKKDTDLFVFDAPFDTIQTMLEQELKRREDVASGREKPDLSEKTLPEETTKPSWLQSKFVKRFVGVCTLAALFFATRWFYSKFAGAVRLPKGCTRL